MKEERKKERKRKQKKAKIPRLLSTTSFNRETVTFFILCGLGASA
jgi:hypothetical protein